MEFLFQKQTPSKSTRKSPCDALFTYISQSYCLWIYKNKYKNAGLQSGIFGGKWHYKQKNAYQHCTTISYNSDGAYRSAWGWLFEKGPRKFEFLWSEKKRPFKAWAWLCLNSLGLGLVSAWPGLDFLGLDPSLVNLHPTYRTSWALAGYQLSAQ